MGLIGDVLRQVFMPKHDYENLRDKLGLSYRDRTGDSEVLPGAFYLTDQETVDYYYMVLLLPSSVVFMASVAYLVAGNLFGNRLCQSLL
ncbi:hypothetical protein Ancab_022874 [Ancistrocladus abbreviatus]